MSRKHRASTTQESPETTAEAPEDDATRLVTADLLGYEVTAPADHHSHHLASFLRDLKVVHERHRRVGPVTITFPHWHPGLLRDR